MGFELKNESGCLFKDNFNEHDFETPGFRSEPLEFTSPLGTTKGMQWFFDGMKMSYAASVFNQPLALKWTTDTEMITMHFNLEGKVSVFDKELPDAFELSGNEHNMFYGKEAEGHIQDEELRLKLFLIQLSKKSFFTLAGEGNDAIKRFADKVAAGKSAAFSPSSLNIDLPLQNCITAILNCRYVDSLKRMYFFSKAMEMLVLQAESFDRSLNKKSLYLKKEYDKERILYARDYLLKNMDCPPTLTELSKIAGINEYKLKRGFKETFNQTVFEYLSDVRLEMAKNDLLEKRKTITEIAFELGYCSLQHFSTAFKKKYGQSPGQARG